MFRFTRMTKETDHMTRKHKWRSRLLILALASAAGTGWWQVWAASQTTEQNAPPPLTAEERENLKHANSLSRAFRTAANRVLPAVVTIRTEINSNQARNNGQPNREIPEDLLSPTSIFRFRLS